MDGTGLSSPLRSGEAVRTFLTLSALAERTSATVVCPPAIRINSDARDLPSPHFFLTSTAH